MSKWGVSFGSSTRDNKRGKIPTSCLITSLERYRDLDTQVNGRLVEGSLQWSPEDYKVKVSKRRGSRVRVTFHGSTGPIFITINRTEKRRVEVG